MAIYTVTFNGPWRASYLRPTWPSARHTAIHLAKQYGDRENRAVQILLGMTRPKAGQALSISIGWRQSIIVSRPTGQSIGKRPTYLTFRK